MKLFCLRFLIVAFVLIPLIVAVLVAGTVFISYMADVFAGLSATVQDNAIGVVAYILFAAAVAVSIFK